MSIPKKIDNKLVDSFKEISNKEFAEKYSNLNKLFNGDVNRALNFASALAYRESGWDPKLQNQIGYTGLWQMRQDTSLTETNYLAKNSEGVTKQPPVWSKEAEATGIAGVKAGDAVNKQSIKKFFTDDPKSYEAQADAFLQYLNKVVTYPKSKQVLGLIENGKEVTFKGEKYPATPEGLLAAIHLLGHSGSHYNLILGNKTTDGNGTSAQEYVATFSGKYKNKSGEEYWDRDGSYAQISKARGAANISAAEAAYKPKPSEVAADDAQTPKKKYTPYATTESESMNELMTFLTILMQLFTQVGTQSNTKTNENAAVPVVDAKVASPPLPTPTSASATGVAKPKISSTLG